MIACLSSFEPTLPEGCHLTLRRAGVGTQCFKLTRQSGSVRTPAPHRARPIPVTFQTTAFNPAIRRPNHES